MNGLENRHRTLGELMTELRARLGFMTQGSASKNNEVVMKSFLQEAHDYVYGELMPTDMRKKTIIRIKPGSVNYDWHNDQEDEIIEPGAVKGVWLIVSPTLRDPLLQGITEIDRSFSTMRQRPQKYDTINGQCELWPIPEREYDLLVEYTAPKGRFDRMSDRASVKDRLVFLYALSLAKAHYRHPDANAAASTFTNMLNKEKMRQKENYRYFFQGESYTTRATQVAKSANGYTLRG